MSHFRQFRKFCGMYVQRQTALEMLQKNLKEEYRAVVDYEVAFFNTVRTLHPLAPPEAFD